MPLPRTLRRVLAPLLVAGELILLAGFAAMTVVGLVLAPLGAPRRVLRVGAMGMTYVGVELAALAALWGVWLTRRFHPDRWWEDVNRRVLAWALRILIRAGQLWLGFVVTVEEPAATKGFQDAQPILVLARHGGLGDSFVLMWLLLDRYQRTTRVVAKAVLQWEPLLDVALNRLGACFLPPHSPKEKDLGTRVGAVAAGLHTRDALLLFPEGANWTPRRWTRAIDRLKADRKRGAARAAALMPHVLPPRPAGVLACLDARPQLSVVIVAHTGLDGLTTARAAWRAVPFAPAMTVRWWPAAAPPVGEAARLEWLTTEWAVVDEWIDARKATEPSRP